MLGIVVGSIVVSPLLGYPERSGASYDTERGWGGGCFCVFLLWLVVVLGS